LLGKTGRSSGWSQRPVAGHTLKVAILDPPVDRAYPDVDALRMRIGERIKRAPRLRRRLEMSPSGGRTGWVDDPTFDVREARARGAGVRVEQRLYEVYTLRTGRILRVDEFSDRAEALEAVGLRE
jgi:ketosteroid isomerase-like protein